MTAPVIDLKAWVAASRAAQNLPPRITDAATLRRVARLAAAQRSGGGDAA